LRTDVLFLQWQSRMFSAHSLPRSLWVAWVCRGWLLPLGYVLCRVQGSKVSVHLLYIIGPSCCPPQCSGIWGYDNNISAAYSTDQDLPLFVGTSCDAYPANLHWQFCLNCMPDLVSNLCFRMTTFQSQAVQPLALSLCSYTGSLIFTFYCLLYMNLMVKLNTCLFCTQYSNEDPIITFIYICI